ncbi:MAG: hypothetical protein IPH87_14155 [Anaerolineae bacterium]|nr:hypothetical protein [Anaerolineae bacterium]
MGQLTDHDPLMAAIGAVTQPLSDHPRPEVGQRLRNRAIGRQPAIAQYRRAGRPAPRQVAWLRFRFTRFRCSQRIPCQLLRWLPRSRFLRFSLSLP